MGGPIRQDPHEPDMEYEVVTLCWCAACGAYEPVDEPKPPPLAAPARPGRNEPCWCGSGQKYKRCHYATDEVVGGVRRRVWRGG